MIHKLNCFCELKSTVEKRLVKNSKRRKLQLKYNPTRPVRSVLLYKKKFPDFENSISKEKLADCLYCVLISHFHLDDCGAWPHVPEAPFEWISFYDTSKPGCPQLLARNYYKLFITFLNEKVQKISVERNMFEYKHISTFERAFADNPGPMVVFVSPGMLHAGLSLQLFRKWAPDSKNMVILPGFCVSGTVGNKILSGVKKIDFFNPKETIDVKLDIEYLSFSAHADAKGIMQLIRMCAPRHVLLVQGEAVKMSFLQKKVEEEYGVPCLHPANAETASIPTPDVRNVLIDKSVIDVAPMHSKMLSRIFDGIIVVTDDQISIISEEQAACLYFILLV